MKPEAQGTQALLAGAWDSASHCKSKRPCCGLEMSYWIK